MDLRKKLDLVYDKRAVEHLEILKNLSTENSYDIHPLEKLLRNPKKLQSWLSKYELTRTVEAKVISDEKSEKTVIQIRRLNDEDLKQLEAKFKMGGGYEHRIMQKFYMDEYGNAPSSMVLKGAYGQTLVELNNVTAMGPDIHPETHINLFIGASDTFTSGLTRRDTSQQTYDWIANIEVPFAEFSANINAGVEGAPFSIISQKLDRVRNKIDEKQGIIDNLFVFGGWHNLLYNDHSEEDWNRYCSHYLGYAPRVCFFQLASPVLAHSYKDICDFCDRGHMFWGNLERNEQNYDQLRQQLNNYNEWLAGFCEQHENALMIPLNDLLKYDANSIENFFEDVNHFTDRPEGRKFISEAISQFLIANGDFFVKKISDNSEYIYPVF